VVIFLSPLVREPGRRWRLEHAESGAVLAEPVEAAVDARSRWRGLNGQPLDAAALVVAPRRFVQTFFLPFAIDTVFVDREGLVVGVRHAIRPNRLSIAWRAFAAIQLAAGRARDAGIQPGDRLVLTPGA
jgi:uncharacterized membrane protein (UPF0127 family)